ncbi:MAG: VRR-NUC domain-containing protein [Candidatus Binatia bacterium]|jgi:hypothetical protein
MSKVSNAEALRINIDGQALEKAGHIEAAIALYEYGVVHGTDTPFTYRRLLVLYRKAKRLDDERRVCELAANRWPVVRNGLGHVQPSDFASRLARIDATTGHASATDNRMREIRSDQPSQTNVVDAALVGATGGDETARESTDSHFTEIIEVRKSGQEGKQAFLDSLGRPTSIEEAAQDYFRERGFKTVRGEVRFWQAMFGLSFWEEIFDGTGTPNALNDIPADLFSGAQFYEARKAQIDEKAAVIALSRVGQFISAQLACHGDTWTRIVFDYPRGDFSYRQILQSPEVAEFLSVISPANFAKIVHRIALNPTENRAGLPDYMLWKGGGVLFIEVKGIREKIRDSQSAWLAGSGNSDRKNSGNSVRSSKGDRR